MNDYASHLDDLIQKTSLAVGKPIAKEKYDIIDLDVPHKPENLPPGMMAVYTFIYNDRFLKIGEAGPNSNNRYKYQHYKPTSANSSLAGELIRDKDFNLDETNVESWIKLNCRRINIVIDASLGKTTRKFIESVLHYVFDPKYEGTTSQRT